MLQGAGACSGDSGGPFVCPNQVDEQPGIDLLTNFSPILDKMFSYDWYILDIASQYWEAREMFK